MHFSVIAFHDLVHYSVFLFISTLQAQFYRSLIIHEENRGLMLPHRHLYELIGKLSRSSATVIRLQHMHSSTNSGNTGHCLMTHNNTVNTVCLREHFTILTFTACLQSLTDDLVLISSKNLFLTSTLSSRHLAFESCLIFCHGC